VTDEGRFAQLEARVEACEEYIQALLLLQEAQHRARLRAAGEHLRLVDW
jgi:hypothetical protein